MSQTTYVGRLNLLTSYRTLQVTDGSWYYEIDYVMPFMLVDAKKSNDKYVFMKGVDIVSYNRITVYDIKTVPYGTYIVDMNEILSFEYDDLFGINRFIGALVGYPKMVAYNSKYCVYELYDLENAKTTRLDPSIRLAGTYNTGYPESMIFTYMREKNKVGIYSLLSMRPIKVVDLNNYLDYKDQGVWTRVTRVVSNQFDYFHVPIDYGYCIFDNQFNVVRCNENIANGVCNLYPLVHVIGCNNTSCYGFTETPYSDDTAKLHLIELSSSACRHISSFTVDYATHFTGVPGVLDLDLGVYRVASGGTTIEFSLNYLRNELNIEDFTATLTHVFPKAVVKNGRWRLLSGGLVVSDETTDFYGHGNVVFEEVADVESDVDFDWRVYPTYDHVVVYAR